VRHVLDACEQAAGQRAESVVVCGGGSRSRFWNQIKADVLQRPVQAAGVSQSACLGAAILAGVGVGVDDSLAGACRRLVRLNEPLAPNPANGAAYERAYQVYRALYPALAPVFHRQADGFARNEVR
jgi:xylulokinase